MSEFMKSMASRSSGGSRPPLQANICLQITGFDLEAKDGARVEGLAVSPAWMRGQTVSVRMQNEAECLATFRGGKTEKENKKFFANRPTVEKWANGFKVGNNSIEPMRLGGYLMMHGCLTDGPKPENGEPGRWKAQYSDNYGNDASREVVAGVARISVREKGDFTYAKAEILYPNEAVIINSPEDLSRFFADHMSGERDGAQVNGLAALRICSPQGEGENVRHQVMTAYAYSPLAKVPVVSVNPETGDRREFDAMVPQADGAAWDRMATSDKLLRTIYAAVTGDTNGLQGQALGYAESLRKDIQSGAVTIEAIPGQTVAIVGNSLEELLKDGSKLNRAGLRSQYKAKENDADVWKSGFVKMTVGLARSTLEGAPDQVIVSQFAPDVGSFGMHVNNVKTPNVHPVYGNTRDLAEKKAAEASAQRGDDAAPGHDSDHGQGQDMDREHEAEMAGSPGMER